MTYDQLSNLEKALEENAKLCNEPLFDYDVCVVGGRGPDIWDNQTIVQAYSLLHASLIAHRQASECSGWVVLIEQRD